MVALLLTLQLATTPVAPPAILNMPRLLAESVEGKAASAKLEAFRREKEKALTVKRGDVDVLIQKKASAGTIERSRIELQRLAEDSEAELTEMQRSLELDFFGKVQPVVMQILSEDRLGLLFTFPNPIIVWASESVDITPKVIQRLNAAAQKKP